MIAFYKKFLEQKCITSFLFFCFNLIEQNKSPPLNN